MPDKGKAWRPAPPKPISLGGAAVLFFLLETSSRRQPCKTNFHLALCKGNFHPKPTGGWNFGFQSSDYFYLHLYLAMAVDKACRVL
jgi:hypothetical protein